MNKPIIIGAGVSGLSAANYFVDNGVQPIIIEGGKVGQIKVCGEFFSTESIPFLEKWEVPFFIFKKCNFVTPTRSYSLHLPSYAANTSRSMCETHLAQRAVKLGAILLEDTFVTEIVPAKKTKNIHYLKLSSGQTFETDKLIVTTSRLPMLHNTKKSAPNYIGIKAHFENFNLPKELNMYFVSGAYMGITQINDKTVNVCCLAKREAVEKFASVDLFMQNFMNSHEQLKKQYAKATPLNPWLTAYVSKFGKKDVPNWPNSYFIGDAIATIFPAAGNGLAMGLTAGVMSAHHIIFNEKSNFRTEWNRRYKKRLSYARILNSIFISTFKADIAFKFATSFKRAFNFFYKNTRDKYIQGWR